MPEPRPGSCTTTRMTGVFSAAEVLPPERDRHQDLGAAVDVVDPGLAGDAGLRRPGVLAGVRAGPMLVPSG